MDSKKNIGIILIILGFFIPSVLYPFTSYSPEKLIVKKTINAAGGLGYEPRLNDLEVVLVERAPSRGGNIALPYHYIVAIGIIFIFTGVSCVALGVRKKSEKT